MDADTSRRLILSAPVALAVVVSDQLVKAVVKSSLALGERIEVFPGLQLVNVRNTGVAFGLFAGSGAVLILVGLLMLVLLSTHFAKRVGGPYTPVWIGLLVGGALSNVLDRAYGGAVTDYVDPVLWPAFNLADAAIVAGVIGLVIESALPDRGSKKIGERGGGG